MPVEAPAPRSVAIAVSFASAQAVLLFLAAILLLALSIGSASGNRSYTWVGVVGAVVAFAVGMAFVYGARQVRARSGRTFLLVLAATVGVLHLFNILTAKAYVSVVFLAIPVVIVVGLLRPSAAQWLDRRAR